MSEADTLLYLDGVTVSFDGFRALNALSLVLEKGEMRAVIGVYVNCKNLRTRSKILVKKRRTRLTSHARPTATVP